MHISEFFENVRIAFRSMKSNKLRSLLASLGVVIGISFVIIMGWVLSGLDKALEDTFNLIGADMLYVDKWDWSGGGNWKLLQARKDITLKQALKLSETIQDAELAIPIARKWGASIGFNGETLEGIGIQGTHSEYGLTSGGTIVTGRFFTKMEETQGANVAVLGFGVDKTLFPGKSSLNQIIKIDGHKYIIIGVVKKQSTILMDFIDNQIYIPLRTFLGTFGSHHRSISVAVKAGNLEKLDDIRAETIGLMRVIRNLKPGEPDDFSINETKAFEKSVEQLRLYVWGIGIGMTVLSFIVGIIGIMNIMFVTVTERTKEIGIRKAIGAKKRSILIQFIVESAALCFLGAIVSFIFCSILIYLVGTFLPKAVPQVAFLSPFMPYQLLLIATIVSFFVGILAGYIPAVRASNLDPVDALRFE